MSGFSTVTDGDFDRVFMKGTELVDRFVGTKLWVWGYDGYGQLGDNSTTNKSTPVQTVAGGTGWSMVACGYYHSATTKTDGTLWSCGYGTNLGDGTPTKKSSPVQTVAGGNNWKLVTCGLYHTAAIKSDGTLWTWGNSTGGALGDNTLTSRDSPVQTVAGGNNWVTVSGGRGFTAAIKSDGTLWTWGYNPYGQLGDNTAVQKSSPVQTITGGTNWKQVSCGYSVVSAIKTDGTLWLWGSNYYGELGDNTTVSKSSPVQTITGGTNWKQVSVGHYSTAAIKTDGTLWSWGYNPYGELGDNTTENKSSPVQTVTGGTNWKFISRGGSYHSVAIKTDGTLWSWGRNDYGQLGDNTVTHKSSPIQNTAGGTNWKQVTCGLYHTAAIGE